LQKTACMDSNVSMSFIIVFCLAVLLVAVSGYLAVQLKKSRKREISLKARYRDLELTVNHLQLETLEAKLNPHLFKNVLNSIQSHAYQTYYALDKLANVLDYILYESRRKFVTPEEEIRFALNLIEINKIKLSPLFDLKVKTKIDENESLYNEELLAPLISVDLIENAFKHADIRQSDAFISVVIGFSNDTFHLSVSNKISGKSPLSKPHGGLGTQNLEQRLQILYDHSFKLERYVDEDVYHVLLKINLREHKDKMFAAGR